MAVMTPERQTSSPHGPNTTPQVQPRSSVRRLQWVAVVQAGAFVVLVGLEGSVVGRSIRIGAVLCLTALGIAVMRRAGALAGGACALMLGIAGTVAGVGIGGVYLAKQGLSLIAIAGMIALASGLWLLVAGGVTLVRRLPRWWRLLAIPAALALLMFVVYPLTVAVNATNRPATPVGAETPADRGFAYEDVSFRTSDGVRLSAWYVPSRNGAAVVLLHGSGSTRSSVLAHGTVLARHGYGVLLLDTRGHGRSGGHAMDFGWFGDLDVEAAVSFVAARPDVTRSIGIVGVSMGGEQAIAAAGVDGRIRAVVAEGVTGMQAADHGWLERYGFQGSIQQVIDRVMYGAAGVLSGAERPMALRDAIRAAAPRPVLLIAGGAEVDEAIAGRWFRQASPRSVQLWIVPGAGHTAGLARRADEWEDRVIGFLAPALGVDEADGAN